MELPGGVPSRVGLVECEELPSSRAWISWIRKRRQKRRRSTSWNNSTRQFGVTGSVIGLNGTSLNHRISYGQNRGVTIATLKNP